MLLGVGSLRDVSTKNSLGDAVIGLNTDFTRGLNKQPLGDPPCPTPSKYGYRLDGPIPEEGRAGVAVAWKTSKWTLQAMQFLSPRALKASLLSRPLEITLLVVHTHHKHSRRQAQWKEMAKELHGPNLILCADHNSLIVKQRDAFAPLEFQPDTSLRAKDVWVDIHSPTLMDIKDKEPSRPTGFTYGYPPDGERLDTQRVRRIDRIHATLELLNLATCVYPMFAANSDHKAVLAIFTPPSFETEGTASRFHCPEAILHDQEAMQELEASLQSISSTVGRCIGLHPKSNGQLPKGTQK